MKKLLLLLLVSVLTITIQAQNPISSPPEKQEIVTYPNPVQSQGVTNVVLPSGFLAQKIILVTASGKPLGIWSSNPVLFLPKLATGSYFLAFWNKDKFVGATQIVVR